MRKIFKQFIASLTAATMLVTGMTSIVSNAANFTEKMVDITSADSTYSLRYSYLFSNVGQSGTYASGNLLTLRTSTRITISFGGAMSSQAAVTIVNSSNTNETYGTFIIPTDTATTLYTYYTLPAGSYKFYVVPYYGTKTSGSFLVTV